MYKILFFIILFFFTLISPTHAQGQQIRIFRGEQSFEQQNWLVYFNSATPSDTRTFTSNGNYSIAIPAGNDLTAHYFPIYASPDYDTTQLDSTLYITLRMRVVDTTTSYRTLRLSNLNNRCEFQFYKNKIDLLSTTIGTISVAHPNTQGYWEYHIKINGTTCTLDTTANIITGTTTLGPVNSHSIYFNFLASTTTEITDIYLNTENFVPKSTSRIISYFSEEYMLLFVYGGTVLTTMSVFLLFYIGIKTGLTLFRR